MARVLVVDDQAEGREAVSRFLAVRGRRLTAAANGEEALERLVTDRPHVMIVDVRMPNLDGVGLLEARRAYRRWNRLPVILLAADAGPDELRRARDLGVSRVFEKEMYDLRELESAVDACLTPPPSPDC
jgi:CheY-like chemotaxis protein